MAGTVTSARPPGKKRALNGCASSAARAEIVDRQADADAALGRVAQELQADAVVVEVVVLGVERERRTPRQREAPAGVGEGDVAICSCRGGRLEESESVAASARRGRKGRKSER